MQRLHDLLAARIRRRPQRKYSRAARISRAPSQPRAAELAYTSDLIGLVREVQQLVRAEIFPLLNEIAGKHDALYGQMANRFRFVEQRARQIVEVKRVTPIIDAQAVRLDKFNRGQVAKQIGIDFSNDAHVQLRLHQFRDKNVQLIRSLPTELLDQVSDTLTDAQARGARVEEIQDDLEERFGVSESRAALIARDQTLKTNADLTQARMADVGINEYIWTTAGDERVRLLHKALDGTPHSWLTPPVTNDRGERNAPGKDFQCRCWADPVIPEM